MHLSFSFWTLWSVFSRLAPGWCSLYHPPPVGGAEVAFQVYAHLAVQRGVDEGVVTGRAHGHEVTADLQDVDVPLANHLEVWVQVQQQVQHLHSDVEKSASQPCLECFYFVYCILLNVSWSRTQFKCELNRILFNNLHTVDSDVTRSDVTMCKCPRVGQIKILNLDIHVLNNSEYTYFGQMHVSVDVKTFGVATNLLHKSCLCQLKHPVRCIFFKW